ncbi:MAG: hypothetical protein DRJ38_02860 [Thermoprotei archaeon]|nr:MAG: hypothetical protein DRJ38_02860 [Thermoprotei archaeon]
MEELQKALQVDVEEAGYEFGKLILRNVHLTLEKGELLLLLGPTGSGKSTFILMITGVLNNLLYGYVKGTVRLFDINPLEPEGFRQVPRYIGVVLQSHELQIAMQTPLDEVLFTLENLGVENAFEKAKRVLDKYGLLDKAEVDVETLSGGEKKRLCLASSIVHEPELFILDEPTANLDPWGEREILNYVLELRRRGKTVIITEHKPRYFLKIADKIAVIENHTLRLGLKNSKDFIYSATVSLKKRREKERREIVRLEKVKFRYCSECSLVLRDTSLQVFNGENVAIIGPNGSGKTTLGKIISGLLKPIDGEVRIAGAVPWQLKPRELLKKVIYIPQEPNYFFVRNTVEEELKLAAEYGSLKLEDVVKNLESWILDKMNESPYRLSYGQKKWLTYIIARIYGSKVVVFDEPTAGLDFQLVKKFFTWLKEEGRTGVTSILLTHDVRVLENAADRVFIIENGEVKEVSVREGIEILRKPVEEWFYENQS